MGPLTTKCSDALQEKTSSLVSGSISWNTPSRRVPSLSPPIALRSNGIGSYTVMSAFPSSVNWNSCKSASTPLPRPMHVMLYLSW